MSDLICSAASFLGINFDRCQSGPQPKAQAALKNSTQEDPEARSFLEKLLFGDKVAGGAVGCGSQIKARLQKIIDTSIEELNSKEDQTRLNALRTLIAVLAKRLSDFPSSMQEISSEYKTKIAQALIRCFTDGNNYIREEAIFAIRSFSIPEVSEELLFRAALSLINIFPDHVLSSYRSGTQTIGDIAAESLIEITEKLSEERQSEVVNKLIENLVKRKMTREMETLCAIAVFTPYPNLRDKIVEFFIGMTGNDDEKLKVNAMLALNILSRNNLPHYLRTKMIDPLISLLGWKQFIMLSSPQGPAIGLVNLMESDLPLETKAEMINRLEEILENEGEEQCLPPSDIVQNTISTLKQLALSKIPLQLKARIIEILIKSLFSRDYNVRYEAEHTLREIGLSTEEKEIQAKLINLLIEELLGRGESSDKSVVVSILRYLFSSPFYVPIELRTKISESLKNFR